MKDKRPTASSDNSFPVVVIGAGAGAKQALERIISAIPADSGMAFAVILGRTEPNANDLAELLAGEMKIEVCFVRDLQALKPNRIHLIPPLKIRNDVGATTDSKARDGHRSRSMPISQLFRAAAELYGYRTIGIILSGRGSDGSRGIREIKAKGGFTIVQDPRDAEYGQMPRKAIETGVVDIVAATGKLTEILFARPTSAAEFPSRPTAVTNRNAELNLPIDEDNADSTTALPSAGRETEPARLAGEYHPGLPESPAVGKNHRAFQQKPVSQSPADSTPVPEDHRVLLDAADSDFAVFSTDNDLRIDYWNSGAEAIFGYSASEILGQPLSLLIAPEEHRKHWLEREIRRAVRQGQTSRERFYRRRDGSSFYAFGTLSPLRNDDGAIRGFVGIVRDLAFQHGLDGTPRKQEQDIEILINRSPFLLARCGRDLRYKYVSRAYAEMVGLEPEQLNGQLIRQVIGEEGFNTIYPYIVRVLAGSEVEYESRIRFKNAGERILRIFYTPDREKNGKVVGWVASILDITDQKLADAALQESEKRFRSIFTGNMTAMGIWNQAGTVTEANDALLDLLGYSRDDLRAGRINWLDLTAPEFRHLDIQALAELSEKGICEPFEKAYITKSGTRVPVICGGSCFAGEKDKGLFFVVDLTEPKRREANLAFLTDVTEDLANLSNADEIMQTISAKIGRFLDISSCLFAEIDEPADSFRVPYAWRARSESPELVGNYSLSDFISDGFRQMARNKETIIIRNTQTDPRTNAGNYSGYEIQSFVTVPFHRNREWKYLFTVNDKKPRDWRRDEVELIDEITNRLFPRLERARAEDALRKSEAQLRLSLTASAAGTWTWDILRGAMDWDDRFQKIYGFADDFPRTLETWLNAVHPDDRGRLAERIDEIIKSPSDDSWNEEFRAVNPLLGERWILSLGRIERNSAGQALLFTGIHIDITDRQQHEAKMRTAAEFDAFRVCLIDALRALERPEEIKSAAVKILGRQLKADRVYYAEIEANDKYFVIQPNYFTSENVSNLAGRYRIGEFGKYLFEEMRANRPLVVSDLTEISAIPGPEQRAFDRLDVRSLIWYPLMKDDRLIAVLGATHSTPRQWTDAEFAQVKETAERTWAAVERNRAERALQQSESQMRIITDAMPGLISYIDAEYRYQFVNKVYTDWFGYPSEAVIGRTMSEVLGEKAFAELRPHLDFALAGNFEIFENEAHYKQGTRYIRASYTPDFARDGRVRGIFVLVLDLTDRKLQEEALRQSEERYRGIVNQSISGIAETDLEGRFLTVNNRYCEIVGYSRKELLGGMSIHDLTHPADFAENEKKFKRLVKHNVTFEIEKRYIRKDGTSVWVNNSVFGIKDRSGRPQSIAAVVLDISHRKEAEDELREREYLARMNAEVSRKSLLSGEGLAGILEDCTDTLVKYLDAAFVRIWLLDETENVLELRASSGIYTHLDGEHSRIPIGRLKIGLIASERRPHWTNDVAHDEQIRDKEWAARDNIVAFAGYPLVADERLVGVIALFSHHPLSRQKYEALGQAANSISSGIIRKRAEDALRESEERFRNMADHAPVMIWVTEADGSCSYLSKSWYDFTGQTPETGLGFGFVDAIHPDDREADQNVVAEASRNEEAFRFEHRLRHRNGEYSWVICSAQPRFDESGEFLGFIGSVLDITDRKEVEAKLLAKDELLTQITNVTPTLLTRCSRDLRYLFVNRSAAEFLGRPAEQIIGRPIREIMGDAVFREILPYMQRVLRGEYIEYETEIEYAAAGRRFVQVIYVPERNKQQKVIGWFATMTDLTERKKSEETRAFLASIIESSDDAVISKDLVGTITSWNKGAEKIFGFAAGEIIGKPITTLIPAILGDEEQKIIERLQKEESIEHYETVRQRKDGSLVNVSLTVSPIRDRSGRIVGASKIARDITERKQAEMALRQSEARLKLAMKISALGTWDLDYQNGVMIWSDKMFEIFGLKPTDDGRIALSECLRMIHPEDIERVRQAMSQARQDHRLFNAEYRIRRKDTGETRWLSALAQFFYDEEDVATRSVGIVRDITMNKEAEDKLRQSEEFNSSIASISTDWAFSARVDADGTVIPDAITEGFTRQLGYRFEKMSMRGGWEVLVHPKDLPFALKELERLLKGETVRGEIRLVSQEGHTVISEYQTRPIMDDDGRVSRIYGAIRDITMQKLSEQSLRESEERLQDVISSATEYAIFTVTLNGIIDSWSVGAERIFGYTVDEILGQSFELLFTPINRRKKIPALEMKNVLRQGRASDDRFHLRKDGTRFFASGVMMPLLKNGIVTGFVKITRDMTNQLAAEKAVRDKEILQKMVIAQEEERRRIARDLHDELGQQLTALRFKLEGMRRISGDEAIANELSTVQAIAKQIDQGVDFLAWELRPVALDDLGLYAALDKYVHEWTTYSGISAELLPSTVKGQRFASEIETNLYRIAQEALNNVSKHAVARKVEIQLEKRNNILVLIISDNGVGFNPNTKNIINKGIGLIGMRERALLIGGHIEIESTEGEGTAIYVRVPVSFNRKEKNHER